MDISETLLLSHDDLCRYVENELAPWLQQSFLNVEHLDQSFTGAFSIRDIIYSEAGLVPEALAIVLDTHFDTIDAPVWISINDTQTN